ncbi:TBC1 domain family member 31-like [Dysidea avara]|uniref:TBC1 domain family member 31-like n=1 Tax=Dysidea avara TaxID=196820 RepID=UPI0033346912
MIAIEERKLLEQRKRLQAMKREMRVKELKMLDGARQRFMQHHQQVKEAELKRLDDEIKRKILLREEETKIALDDADIKAVELDAQKALLEQELLRKHEEAIQLMRANTVAHGQQEELERELLERALEEGGAGDKAGLLGAQSQLGKTQLRQANLQMQHEMEALQQLNDLQREMNNGNLLQKSQAISVKQKQIHSLAEGLKDEEYTVLKERGKQLLSTRMDQVVDDNRRMGKISQLGQEHLNIDTTTSTDTTKSNAVTEASAEEPASTDLSVSSWVRRRETLDRQEAELLSRVRNLRHRVLQQSLQQSRDSSANYSTSLSTEPFNSVVTPTTDHNT